MYERIHGIFEVEKPVLKPPSRSWARNFGKSNPVKYRRERQIEDSRNKQSTAENVKKWFEEIWQPTISGVDHRFIFNFDEFGSGQSKRKLLVTAPSKARLACTNIAEFPDHITGISTISVSGGSLGHFIIVPRRTMQHLPAVFSEYRDIHIIGDDTGYMNKSIYSKFIDFVIERIEQRRREYNYSGKVVLLADNHSTRANPDELRKLVAAGIEQATLPPHTTHVMQPVDLGVVSAFRAQFGKIRVETPPNFFSQNHTSKRERHFLTLLYITCEAMTRIATPATITASWQNSKLMEENVDLLLEKDILTAASLAETRGVDLDMGPRRRIAVNGAVLTHERIIALLDAQRESRASTPEPQNAEAADAAGRKRMKYNTVTFPGMRVVDHVLGENREPNYIIRHRSFPGDHTCPAKESELSRTIVRNYRRKRNLE